VGGGSVTKVLGAGVTGSPVLVNNGTITGGIATTDTNTQLTFSFGEIATTDGATSYGGDTGRISDITYASGANDNVADATHSVLMLNIGAGAFPAGINETDGAKPFVMSIETGDINGTVVPGAGEDNGNGDGFIDNFKFYFSEPVKMADATAISQFQVANGANLVSMNVGADFGANTGVNDTAGSITPVNDNNVLNNSVVFYGTSDRTGAPDTGLTPRVTWPGNTTVVDTNGLVLVAGTTGLNTIPLDKAKPVIMQAIGIVGQKYIFVTFSEPVFKAAGATVFTGAGENSNVYFNYFNANAGQVGDGATAIDAGAGGSVSYLNAAQTKLKIFVNNNLTIPDVVNDMINPTAAAVFDASSNAAIGNANGIIAVGPPKISIRITINDTIPPYLIAAQTMDVNNNGFVDYIKLTTSEDVDMKSLIGWVDVNADGYPDDPMFSAVGWDILGYSGETFNFIRTGGPAPVSPATWTFVGQPHAGEASFPWSGSINDHVIYIKVTEQSGPMNTFTGIGDTDAHPNLGLTVNPATGINLQDFRTNVFVSSPHSTPAVPDYQSITDVTFAVDRASPVIMNAVFTSETELRIKLSEQINDALIVGNDRFPSYFNLFVGSNRSTQWGSKVKDFAQVDPLAGVFGYISGQWTTNDLITAGNDGAVEFAGVGVFSDISPAANAVIASGIFEVSITPFGGGGAPVVNPIAKAVLSPVPATKPAINNENVTMVVFNGTANPSDVVAVKLVDFGGVETTAVEVTANAVGNFTGMIDASALANGAVTLKAGKIVVGGVTTYFTFADYNKETLTIGAPADLAVTDVPNDQGGFVDLTFTKSANDAGNTSNFYAVDYYVLQAKKGTDWFTVATLPVDGNTDTIYRAMEVWVGMEVAVANNNFRLNAHSKYSGTAKIAADGPDAMSSPYAYASGSAVDNVLPGALTQFKADGSAGAGVVVSFTAPVINGLVNAQYNIYGVDKYDVYRKTASESNYTLAGSANPIAAAGTITFTDNVPNGSTVYNYLVKAVDGSQVVETAAVRAMASKDADFDGSKTIGLGDLVLLGANWNINSTNPLYLVNFDLNKDNSVGLADLVILGSEWGTSVAKIAEANPVPTVTNPFELKAEVNEGGSMYFVNVNIKDAATYNGVAFTLNYDTKAFEFVKDSVNGLVGISLANEKEPGMIDVASYFQNEKFNGIITLGFKSKGLNSDMNLKMSNAEVSINDAVSAVSGAPAVTLKALPTVYGLSQNFPNPFNPSTTITYSVPKTSRVELSIYNMAGQKVRTLVNSTQAASFYKVVWNGKNDSGQSVASGMYFYKLVAGDYSKVVKMNLIPFCFIESKGRYYAKNLGNFGNDVTDILPGKFSDSPIKCWRLFFS